MDINHCITHEPVLALLRDRQFLQMLDFANAMQPLQPWLDGSSPELLTRFLASVYDRVPEAKWLSNLLTATELNDPTAPTDPLSPGAAYMPAPGRADAVALAPDPTSETFCELVPPAYRRSNAWLVTEPAPFIILLTYDPALLRQLPHEDIQNFWRELAVRRRPDLKATLIEQPLVIGLTSFHQFVRQDASWRRFPTPKAMSDHCSQEGISLFFATELAVYGWQDRSDDEQDEKLRIRKTERLRDVIYRHVHVRPPVFLNIMGSEAALPPLQDFRLHDPVADFWRRSWRTILNDCVENGDSDIHVLAKEDGGLNVLRRRHGNMEYLTGVPADSTTACYKAILAGTSIDPGTLPHEPKDGRSYFYAFSDRRRIDIRFNLEPGAPPFSRPACVLRLLDPATIRGGLPAIFIDDLDRRAWEYALSLHGGLIVVTGPTGSGKSRTVYSLIQTLHERRPTESFKSAEDPLEFLLGDWFQQNQISASLGVDFDKVVRGLMRADPETIFIGEIRDETTARAAIMAAQSGHYVITTTHTPSPVNLVDRLKEFKIDPETTQSVYRFGTAQRLIGRSCPQCRETRRLGDVAPVLPEEICDHENEDVIFNTGCPTCRGKGIIGRIAVQEYLHLPEKNDELSRAVRENDKARLWKQVATTGIPNVRHRAFTLARPSNPITNIQEVLAM